MIVRFVSLLFADFVARKSVWRSDGVP